MRTGREELGFVAFGKMRSLVQTMAPWDRLPCAYKREIEARVYGPCRVGSGSLAVAFAGCSTYH